MRKIWLVVKREYLTRVRTKGFILSTVGLPLFSVGIFAVRLGPGDAQGRSPAQDFHPGQSRRPRAANPRGR